MLSGRLRKGEISADPCRTVTCRVACPAARPVPCSTWGRKPSDAPGRTGPVPATADTGNGTAGPHR